MHFWLVSLSKKVGHFGPTPPPPHQLVLIATMQSWAWGANSKDNKKALVISPFLALSSISLSLSSLCLSYIVLCEVLLDDLLQEVDPCPHLVVGDVRHCDILHLKYQNNFSKQLVFLLQIVTRRSLLYGGSLLYLSSVGQQWVASRWAGPRVEPGSCTLRQAGALTTYLRHAMMPHPTLQLWYM